MHLFPLFKLLTIHCSRRDDKFSLLKESQHRRWIELKHLF
ncbi:hypothetical protein X975_07663, partial [Stegodyphus mimosarum]